MTALEKAHSVHQAAMELAEDAFLAERRSDRSAATELHRQAFLLETQAADELADHLDLEPTRSILYRSAATLALRCGELRAAERLATKGLVGTPPEEIADELREVLDEVRKARRSRSKRSIYPPVRVSDTIEEELFFNGITPRGKYLTPPLTPEELTQRVLETGFDVPSQWVLDMTRGRPQGDLRRWPILDTPRKWDLGETGWAVVFAPGIDRRVKGALRDLLEHRESQAAGGGRSNLFRSIDARPGETVETFLGRLDVGRRGDADYFPYYVLLVGDPESLPYSFQQDLDVGYAVGRICFDRPEDYQAYARNVVHAETKGSVRPRQVTFFGTSHENDPVTQGMAQRLVFPLSEQVVKPGQGWEICSAIGADARKEQLCQFLGGPQTPALLFAACHGLGMNDYADRQRETQGALVCQDWPGPDDEHGIDDNQWFAAADISEDASLQGLIAFFVACYGVGTPARDSFSRHTLERTTEIASSFVSRLPQRMLSHLGGGALAVVGHVGQAWGAGFMGTETYLYALQRLLEGHTVGWAVEALNIRYASYAAQLASLWESERVQGTKINPALFSYLWGSANDARNYVVFGDPAVRLQGVGEPR